MTTREASAAFVAPLLVLSLGHMLSNLLRTLPAISADVLARDLDVTAEGLASLTGAYHFAFAAGQIPLGVALDRYGVRPVSLALLATVIVGAALAALAGGSVGFLLGQVVLGLGSCGMLLCPMTLAAKLLTPAKFGLWSGLIQATGNLGMLLSASPLAWLVEESGWRSGYWAAGALSVLVAALVARFVPGAVLPVGGSAATGGTGADGTAHSAAPVARTAHPPMLAEAREVLRLGASRRLRGVMILAFASFAALIGLRGLWGGPWLMDGKGLGRIEAGHVLLLFTLALIAGPALAGLLDRRIGRQRAVLAAGHALAGVFLLLVVVGGPDGALSRALGVPALPAAYDTAMFFLFGLSIAVQPLIFAMTRAAVPPERAGKALSAVNLSFFAGAAVLQAATGPVAAGGGVGAALGFLAAALLLCTGMFLVATRR